MIVLPALLLISLYACGDSAEDGDTENGAPGHCFADNRGEYCQCGPSDAPTVEYGNAISTCAASGDKHCCAAPREGAEGEPYTLCTCSPGTCPDFLVDVPKCDGALYYQSGSSGTSGCDQCQYDSECDYACATSERGVFSKDSGCGSCYCELGSTRHPETS